MYKVLKLWPSFKHFNSTRQMASPEWSALCHLYTVSDNCNEQQNDDNNDDGFQIL